MLISVFLNWSFDKYTVAIFYSSPDSPSSSLLLQSWSWSLIPTLLKASIILPLRYCAFDLFTSFISCCFAASSAICFSCRSASSLSILSCSSFAFSSEALGSGCTAAGCWGSFLLFNLPVVLFGIPVYLVGFVYGLITELPVGRFPSVDGVLFIRTVDVDEPTDEPPSGLLTFLLWPSGFTCETLLWVLK